MRFSENGVIDDVTDDVIDIRHYHKRNQQVIAVRKRGHLPMSRVSLESRPKWGVGNRGKGKNWKGENILKGQGTLIFSFQMSTCFYGMFECWPIALIIRQQTKHQK